MILKHLLPADDRHTVIAGRTHVEVIPDSLITLKVPCYGKTNPCKILFRYYGLNNEQLDPKLQELDVYVAQDNTLPCEERH